MQSIKFNFDYLFELGFCLDLDNLDNKTNKLFLHYTVHSIHYKVFHKNQSAQEQQEGEDTGED